MNIEIDPTTKNDANDTRNSSASSFAETVIVLGSEVKIMFLIKPIFIGNLNLGNIALLRINGIWVEKCKNAPSMTP